MIMRMFIGLNVPKEGKVYIYENIKDLVQKYRFKWVDYNLYHLTLKFLGEIDEMTIRDVDEKLEEISGKHKAFKVRLKNIGKFPFYGDKVSVIWVGVEHSKDLESLALDIQSSFKHLGDDKPFSPHITIARNKDHRLSINLEQIHLDYQFLVDKIILFESVLYPSGPIYSAFRTYALKF